MDRVGKVFKAISPSGVPAMVYFLSRHGDGVTLPLLASAVASVKAAGFARVASIGFCWGGRYSALLGAGLARGPRRVILCPPSHALTRVTGA